MRFQNIRDTFGRGLSIAQFWPHFENQSAGPMIFVRALLWGFFPFNNSRGPMGGWKIRQNTQFDGVNKLGWIGVSEQRQAALLFN